MTHQDPVEASACQEQSRLLSLRRRTLLAGLGAGALTSSRLFGEAMQSVSFGAAGDHVTVVISFRGGIDGLGVVVPHGDPGYYAARPTIAIPRASLVGADAMFGLHPGLSGLLPMWQAGQLAAVHAVGMPAPTRSHFDAMEKIEDADPGSPARVGWINRMLGEADGSLAGLQVGGSATPTSLVGPVPTFAVRDVAELQVSGLQATPDQRYDSLAAMWAGETDSLGAAARSSLLVSRTYEQRLSTMAPPQNGAVYPREYPYTDFSDAMRDAAGLIRAEVGARAICVELGGWDLHATYGTLAHGQMQAQLPIFARTLAAFWQDLGPALQQRVTVVTLSEFGRRVGENGNQGLDHGWGNMMLVLGGGVRGGRYYGTWPGLGAGSLRDGDLPVTTDYRQVLGEVVAKRYPDRSVAQVFPGVTYRPLGILA